MRKIRRMFWDIETSPNVAFVWRCGWKLTVSPHQIIEDRQIVCICWKWEGEKKIHSLDWTDPKMIEKFLAVASEADEMIAHNGDHFDLPWFQGQLADRGLDPLPEIKTVDTYLIAKRQFDYNSYKLDELAYRWFGERKIPTNFDLWVKVKAGNKRALKKMIKYCKRDVEIQEMVWGRLAPFYRPKCHVGVLAGKPRWTCPHDGSDNVYQDKVRATAAGIERYQFKCKDCGRYYTVPKNVYNDYLESD